MAEEIFIRLAEAQLACTDDYYEWSAYVTGVEDVAFAYELDHEKIVSWLQDMWREKKEKKHD